jgi:small subunit ribosomal protein S6
MSRKYEATIVIDPKGKDDSVENIVNLITRDFEQGGAKLEQVDNLGKKKFQTAPRHVDGGFYVHILFSGGPTSVDAIQGKLKLNSNIYLSHFQRR